MRTQRAAWLALLAVLAVLATAGSAAAAASTIAIDIGSDRYRSNRQTIDATSGPTGVTIIARPRPGFQGLRIDIAAPVGGTLAPGVYEGMVRAGSQTATVGGLLVLRDGQTCGVVEGRVEIREIGVGDLGRVTRLVASFTQRCDGAADVIAGEIRVTQTRRPPILAQAGQPRGDVYSGGETGSPGARSFALGLTDATGRRPRAVLRRAGRDLRLFTAPGGRSFTGDVDAARVVWQTTRQKGGRERSRIAVASLASPGRYLLISGGWLWDPVVDGLDLAYNKGEAAARKKWIIARRATRGPQRVIASATGTRTRLGVTGLGGDLIAYARCAANGRCTSHLVRLRGAGPQKQTLQPPAGAFAVYSADPAPDGTVYAVASARGCGASARIVRYRRETGYETIADLPRRVDAQDLSVQVLADGTTRIAFTRYDCARNDAEAVAIVLPAPLAPPPAPGQT